MSRTAHHMGRKRRHVYWTIPQGKGVGRFGMESMTKARIRQVLYRAVKRFDDENFRDNILANIPRKRWTNWSY